MLSDFSLISDLFTSTPLKIIFKNVTSGARFTWFYHSFRFSEKVSFNLTCIPEFFITYLKHTVLVAATRSPCLDVTVVGRTWRRQTAGRH